MTPFLLDSGNPSPESVSAWIHLLPYLKQVSRGRKGATGILVQTVHSQAHVSWNNTWAGNTVGCSLGFALGASKVTCALSVFLDHNFWAKKYGAPITISGLKWIDYKWHIDHDEHIDDKFWDKVWLSLPTWPFLFSKYTTRRAPAGHQETEAVAFQRPATAVLPSLEPRGLLQSSTARTPGHETSQSRNHRPIILQGPLLGFQV